MVKFRSLTFFNFQFKWKNVSIKQILFTHNGVIGALIYPRSQSFHTRTLIFKFIWKMVIYTKILVISVDRIRVVHRSMRVVSNSGKIHGCVCIHRLRERTHTWPSIHAWRMHELIILVDLEHWVDFCERSTGRSATLTSTIHFFFWVDFCCFNSYTYS